MMHRKESSFFPRRLQATFKLACCLCLFVQGGISLYPQTVTFSDHIAPILQKNCVECHNPNGIGPFSLLNYEQVQSRARQIAEVVETRFMPPWKPSPHYGPKLIGEKRLSDEEIDLITTWRESGQLPGTGSQTIPAPPDSDTWKLGSPDLILELPGDYVLPPEGMDIYHNFVIPLPEMERKYIRAVEFQPQAKLVIHHAQITLDTSPWSRNEDAAESGPGFPGMELGNAQNPSGYFIGWTPGQIPFQSHPGAAWELDPGVDLVLRLHMLPSGKPVRIKPKIGLYFTNEVPTRKTVSIKLSEQKIDIPPGDSDYVIEESLTLPKPVSVLGLYPHAHYLAKDMQIFAKLPNGEKQGLLRIPDWDFNWQSDFRYEKPLPLSAGSTLVMRYSYDNSAENFRNPFDPPRRVSIGWNSSDEMGEIAINVLLEDPADLAAIKEAKTEYLRKSIGDSLFSYKKGMEYMEQNKLTEAQAAFSDSLKSDPSYAEPANNLGVIQEREGRFPEARRWYEHAITLAPENESFLLNLFVLLEDHFSVSEAQNLLKAFLEKNPTQENIRIQLADSFIRTKQIPLAIETLSEGVKQSPDSPVLNLRLGLIYSQAKLGQNATKHLQVAATAKGDSPELRAIQADAWYALSLQAIANSDVATFQHSLQKTFERKLDHKGASFFAANGAFRNGDAALAIQYLKAIVDRPVESRLSPGEWIAGLAFPQGQLIVADMYKNSGYPVAALQLLALSLQHAQENRNAENIRLLTEALLSLKK